MYAEKSLHALGFYPHADIINDVDDLTHRHQKLLSKITNFRPYPSDHETY